MNSNNKQPSLNNKENLAPSLPIGSNRNPTTHCNSQTGEVADNQEKPLTNKKTTNISHEKESSEKCKTADSVFKVPLPPKKLLYRKYVLEGKGREDTEKALDLSRNRKAAPTRQTSPLQGLKTPKASPQKNKTPTNVTTTKIGNLSAQQQKRDTGAQTSTAHAQRPIVIVSPTHQTQKRAPAAQTNAPSFNQSRANVHEQQLKKLKMNGSNERYINLIRRHFDQFTVEDRGIEFVIIGVNGTPVWKEFLLGLNWYKTGSSITRKLLCHLFDQKTLATHTLTGKPSPVFLDKYKAERRQLDQLVVDDIIEFMVVMKDMKASDVKEVINKKCMILAKMFLRNPSAKPVAPPEANVARKPETAVSSERNVISVPEAASTNSSERNVITESEAASSDSRERNVRMEPETVEVSSDSDSSEIAVV